MDNKTSVNKSTKRNFEDWMNRKWRPLMAYTYMLICIFDFIIFPILWSLPPVIHNTQLAQWKPMTLDNGGLFHVAMGAVLGVAAWSRGQEKLTILSKEENNV